ncbi:MAG: hypothetical protein JRJ85_18120 [Deltaproteobacteria bacterium]|nr:hypothetical protein [Deltaproteobacteria bacterium]
MSNLIRRDDCTPFSIEPFEAEVLTEGLTHATEADGDACIKLPVGKNPFYASQEKPEEEDGTDTSEEEDVGEKLARLEREAYEQGFEQGRKDGLALETRQMEEKGKQFDALFSEINQLKGKIYIETENDMLKLSMLIAKRVVNAEIQTNEHIIGKTIEAASAFLVDKSRIRIKLSPEDMGEVKALLPDFAAMGKGGQFQLIEDHSIQRGGCIMETGFGRINATIEDQLKELEKTIDQQFEASKRELA